MKPDEVDDYGVVHTKWCGDDGRTALYAGYKVDKDDPIIEAIGTIDELNSFIGLARSFIENHEVNGLLLTIQKDLFVTGADLANPREAMKKGPRLEEERIGWIEKTTLDLDKELPELHNFILAGASKESSFFHVCRSVARRAERRVIATKKKGTENIVKYLNRLSYFLFLLARDYNLSHDIAEDEWRGS